MNVSEINLEGVKKAVTSEKVLILFFTLVSIGIVLGVRGLDPSTQLFPRILATVVVVGCVLLFFQDYLPGPLRTIIVEEERAVGGTLADETPLDDERGDKLKSGADAEAAVAADDRPRTEESAVSPVLNDGFVTAVLIGFYVLASYLVGMINASPMFVLLYTLYNRMSWIHIVVLVAIGYAIPFLFGEYLYLGVDEGVLLP